MNRSLVTAALAAALLVLSTPAFAEELRFLRTPHVSDDGRIAFSYHGDLWITEADGSKPRRLTDHVAEDGRPRFSPDGRWIAFSSNRMGNSDVWIVSVDGGRPRQLTFHSTADTPLYWTPDGQGVVFATSRGAGTWGSPLYIAPVDGSIPVPMEMDRASAGMIRQDGTMVAFNRNGYRGRRKHYRGNNSTDVWVQNRSTRAITQLTDLDLQRSRSHVQDAHPMWGKDGMIYFSSERATPEGSAVEPEGGAGSERTAFNLWKISPSGGAPIQVTHHEVDGVVEPAISPSGHRIVYENEFGLWALDVPDGTPRRIQVELDFDDKHNRFEVLEFDGEADGFSPSPDGSSVAVDVHGEIFLVPTDPELGQKTRLTRSGWRDRGQVWSPDGKTIAHLSDESLEEDIWLYDVESGVRRQLTQEEGLKGQLLWSPDSRRLAFVVEDRLFEADVAAGTSREIAHNPEGGYRLSSYSPGGDWLIYSRSDENLNSDVYLRNLEDGRELNLSQHPDRDAGGELTADGQHLVFLSSRDDGNSHLFVVSLDRLREDPDDPLVRARRAKEASGKGGRPSGGGDREAESVEAESDADDAAAEAADGEEQASAPEELIVDLDGIERRAVQLTRGEASVFSYFLSEDGKKIYYVSGGSRFGRGGGSGAAASLRSIGIDGRDDQKVADGSFRGLSPTADGKRIFYREGDQVHHMSIRGGSKEALRFDLRLHVDKVAEWEQIFEESWRVMKYRFYDPEMHGMDWDAIKARYKGMLPHVGADEDVYDLANEMIGELNASHVGVRGAASRSVEPAYRTALLGFEMEPAGERYAVSHIDRGGPADREWIDLEVGDLVCSIEGHELRAGENYWRHLADPLNDYVSLEVCRPDPSGAAERRTLRIRATSSLRNIRYEAWVEGNRDWVEEYSEGRIAYVHIRSMNQSSLARFENEIDRFWNAKGIVIDIRYNGGGNIDQQLLDILERRPYEYWNSRRGSRAAGRRPRQCIAGPKVMLINHRSGSDSEVTPQGFRDLGLGRIVGNPTAAAVIATGSYSLINGASIRTPGALVTTYDPTQPFNYGTNLENYGVPPDVWVENSPEDELGGFDRELKTAVDEALRMLEEGVWQYSAPELEETDAAPLAGDGDGP